MSFPKLKVKNNMASIDKDIRKFDVITYCKERIKYLETHMTVGVKEAQGELISLISRIDSIDTNYLDFNSKDPNDILIEREKHLELVANISDTHEIWDDIEVEEQ